MDDVVDSLQMNGIVNAMKTGNLQLDLLIAMSIPIVLRLVFGFMSKINISEILSRLKSILRRRPQTIYFERTIIHRTEKDSKSGTSSFANVDTDSNNHVLVKAIMMYLHHLKCLKLKTATLELTSIKAGEGMSSNRNDDYWVDSSDEEDEEDENNALYETLSKLAIVKTPLEEEWHKIGSYPSFSSPSSSSDITSTKKKPLPSGGDSFDKNDCPLMPDEIVSEDKMDDWDGNNAENNRSNNNGLFIVEFRIEKEEKDTVEESGDGEVENSKKVSQRIQKRETKLCFRSFGEHSIDAFIDAAYEWYLNEIKKLGKDHSRFYYEMQEDESNNSNSNNHTYKRYKLSDEKTFDSLFFREKTTIVKLFHHFMNGTGRYGIKGYPQKLGLLLYGPPGTGKTSLIKAVAQYTKRNIVNVPLARIKTNAELNSIFFGNSFAVEGEYYSVKMNFKDIVFVMEDVDAASKIVKRRDGKKTATVTRTEHVDLPVPRSMWRLLLESQGEECKALVALLFEKSERLKAEAQSKDTLQSFAQRMTSIPGLSLAGHEGDVGSSSTVRKIALEALDAAGNMMKSSKALDEYLEFHASMMNALLKNGAEVGEEFENELLGLSSSSSNSLPEFPPKPEKAVVSRDVSYEKYNIDPDHFVEVENASNIMRQQQQRQVPYSISPSGNLTTSGVGFADVLKSFGNNDMVMGDGGGDGYNMGGFDNKGHGKTMKSDGGGSGKLGRLGFGGGGGFGNDFDWMRPIRDELNLSGLLNVLDGVVDTPGRILIMTTNHPEMLDPALIRPGRIDKKLNLGYMLPDDVVQMLEHYFQVKLDANSIDRVECAVRGDDDSGQASLCLTPAQVEQLTAEHDNIDEMITALEKKGQQPLDDSPSSFPSTNSGKSNASGKRRSGRASVITYDGMK